MRRQTAMPTTRMRNAGLSSPGLARRVEPQVKAPTVLQTTMLTSQMTTRRAKRVSIRLTFRKPSASHHCLVNRSSRSLTAARRQGASSTSSRIEGVASRC